MKYANDILVLVLFCLQNDNFITYKACFSRIPEREGFDAQYYMFNHRLVIFNIQAALALVQKIGLNCHKIEPEMLLFGVWKSYWFLKMSVSTSNLAISLRFRRRYHTIFKLLT